jgi:hypothetical protein
VMTPSMNNFPETDMVRSVTLPHLISQFIDTQFERPWSSHYRNNIQNAGVNVSNPGARCTNMDTFFPMYNN